jgi:peptidoglycan hydrolase-like protein with peptidoglycan-binding domain
MRTVTQRVASALVSLVVSAVPVALATAGAASAATTSTTTWTRSAPAQTPSWPLVTAGASGERVFAVQYFLQAHGYRLAAVGSFDQATSRDVRSFQRARHLHVDGIVGPLTWSRLIVTVHMGSTGPAVKALQHCLRYSYGYRIAVDGIFGKHTRAAVRSFQARFRLARDGIVGPKTWHAIIAHES